jgi:hypothetical protein
VTAPILATQTGQKTPTATIQPTIQQEETMTITSDDTKAISDTLTTSVSHPWTRTMHRWFVGVALVFGALTVARPAAAQSCLDSLPPAEQMDADDITCFFLDDVRLYNQIEAAMVAEIVAAATAGTSAVVSGVQASEVDAQDLNDLIDYAEYKEGEYLSLAAMGASTYAAASYGAQMQFIKDQVTGTDHFARYRQMRGLSDDQVAWRMLKLDVRKLWNGSERKARKDMRQHARVDRKSNRRESRDSLKEYKRFVRDGGTDWNTCPDSYEPSESTDGLTGMEYIWARVPKTADGHICYVSGDVPYLYDNGFVDTDRYDYDDWADAMDEYRQDNNTFVLDRDDFISLDVFRANQ